MFRKKVADKKKEDKDIIRWRGHEVTRIEAFSDAVFAFAITLLIVSLEVPETYEELMHGMGSFFSFGLCFAMIFQTWYTQNIFFRRYGLHDDWTIRLNGMLLFTILFFVYPLKFVFAGMFYGEKTKLTNDQMANLICIYSAGFAALYILMGLMYFNAWKRREQLQLTGSEAFETRTHMYRNLFVGGLALLSILNALVDKQYLSLSWLPYLFIGFVIGGTHRHRGKIHRKL